MVNAVDAAVLQHPMPQVEDKEQGRRSCVRNLSHLVDLICAKVIAQLCIVFILDLEYFTLLKANRFKALPHRVDFLIDLRQVL